MLVVLTNGLATSTSRKFCKPELMLVMLLVMSSGLKLISEAEAARSPKVIEKYWSTKGVWGAELDKSKAVLAGHETHHSDAYVCRVITPDGQLIPGKLYGYGYNESYIRKHVCFGASENGTEIEHFKGDNPYEILLQHSPSMYTWKSLSNGDLAHGAVSGGITSTYEPYYICRGRILDTIRGITTTLPGKFQASKGVCMIPYRGVQILSNYEILIDSSYDGVE